MHKLVEAIRQAEAYLGSAKPGRAPSEKKNLLHIRRSVGAALDIPAGVPIRREWLTYLRPARGLPADEFDKVIGKRLSRPVSAGDLIKDEDIVQ